LARRPGRDRRLSEISADLCVVGAGAAGLTVAAVAAQLGVRTVLIERGEMGGECLNTGCVPSKALLAAAKAAQAVRTSHRFGIGSGELRVDFAAVHRHVHGVIAAIAPHDSVERFEGFGVEAIRAEARFLGSRQLVAGNRTIRARRIVIATGSEPAVPPIPGIDGVPYFTNETIFVNDTLPEHLLIIGAGAIGIELAQAYRRLGAAVTVIEAAKAMPRDDPELTATLLQCLTAEGVAIRQQTEIKGVESNGARIALTIEQDGNQSRVEGSHLLVAAGRKPRTAGLDLDRAGVRYGRDGIEVDRRLRTTARGVYAIGDVIAGPRFTHAASYQAGIVIRNALFRLPAKVDYSAFPWVTYTDPELAQVGLTEADARRQHAEDVAVSRFDFAESDRAQAERETIGTAKIVSRGNGRILGASILGAHAGELIQLWTLALGKGLKLRDIAGMIAPYPTFGEVSKMAAAEFYKPKLFGRWTRAAVRVLGRLP
jgi:pyruvate/2-oxoglutarate dehydrogenase complex dihydrolipoamide dehydrogenase (E3) component